jgi:hypothetical protein
MIQRSEHTRREPHLPLRSEYRYSSIPRHRSARTTVLWVKSFLPGGTFRRISTTEQDMLAGWSVIVIGGLDRWLFPFRNPDGVSG